MPKAHGRWKSPTACNGTRGRSTTGRCWWAPTFRACRPVLRLDNQYVTATAGQTFNVPEIGTFSHPFVKSPFTYTIDWGDGTTPDAGTATIYFRRRLPAIPRWATSAASTPTRLAGNYYAAATITDSSGNSDTQTFQVTVNSPPTFLTTSIPDGTVNVGQTYTLPTITSPRASDTHTATIDWGDGTTDNPNVTEPYFDNSLLAPMPGSLTDSHAYSASGDYTGTITLTDESGATASETFTVHVTAADVALTDFSTDGHLLQVSYTISNDTSAPFQIGIYSSPDGMTPDQLLSSYPVGGINSSELTASVSGSHTVSITPPAADVSGDYYLIAVADSDADPRRQYNSLRRRDFPGQRRHGLCLRHRRRRHGDRCKPRRLRSTARRISSLRRPRPSMFAPRAATIR